MRKAALSASTAQTAYFAFPLAGSPGGRRKLRCDALESVRVQDEVVRYIDAGYVDARLPSFGETWKQTFATLIMRDLAAGNERVSNDGERKSEVTHYGE